MSRQHHDVDEVRYLVGWARTEQAKLRRLAAEERLARQLRQGRVIGPFRSVKARLGPVGAAVWAALHGDASAPASAIARDTRLG